MLMQRFEALFSQHQQAMASTMAALAVADATDASPELRLVVYRPPPWRLREGSLVFNQFLNDERLMFRRRYALMDKLSADIPGRSGAPAPPPPLPDLQAT